MRDLKPNKFLTDGLQWQIQQSW